MNDFIQNSERAAVGLADRFTVKCKIIAGIKVPGYK